MQDSEEHIEILRRHMHTKWLILALLLMPSMVVAGETSITNSVSASASTGGLSAQAGNSASSGVVSEGALESHIRVYTEVNGEVMTDIDEITESGEFIVEEEVVRPDEGVDVRTYVRTYVEESAGTEPVVSSTLEGDTYMGAEDATTTSTDTQFSLRSWIADVMSYVFGFFR